MNFRSTTGKTITQAFEEYHAANPHIYELFKQQAFRAINRGKTKISFKAILNYCRWNIYVESTDANSKYRLNDIYSSHYARLFVKDYPAHENKVELRGLRSE